MRVTLTSKVIGRLYVCGVDIVDFINWNTLVTDSPKQTISRAKNWAIVEEQWSDFS